MSKTVLEEVVYPEGNQPISKILYSDGSREYKMLNLSTGQIVIVHKNIGELLYPVHFWALKHPNLNKN